MAISYPISRSHAALPPRIPTSEGSTSIRMILTSFGGTPKGPRFLTIARYNARFTSILLPLNIVISMCVKYSPAQRGTEKFSGVLDQSQDLVILRGSKHRNNAVLDRVDEIDLAVLQPIASYLNQNIGHQNLSHLVAGCQVRRVDRKSTRLNSS